MLNSLCTWWNGLNKLRRNFVLWIAFGVAICSSLMFGVRPLMCPAGNDQWTADSYEYSAPNHHGRQQYGTFVIEKKKTSHSEHGTSENNYTQNFYEVICGEIKATDIALVFFTYVLVLVGLYQMRSTDDTAKRTERAYILCGGLLGNVKKSVDPSKRGYRAKASDFDPPWRMGIHNFGKTPGFIVNIEWGTCAGTNKEMFDQKSVTKIIKEKTFTTTPVTTKEVFASTGSVALHYRHVSPERIVGEIFFGRIDYEDVFKLPHHSTFAILHEKEHSDTIGKSFAEDWS